MEYRILEKYQAIYEIEKSKFIALMIPLDNVNLVKEEISSLKKAFPKANHYCYGYVINKQNKSSDDGEPSGTAGRPILEFILQKQLNNVLLVVIRYFGGIKLGAGGLLRAYVEACRNVYQNSKIYQVTTQNIYLLTLDYKYLDIIKNYLKKINVQILDILYLESVKIKIVVSQIDQAYLLDLTQGQIGVENLGSKEVLIESR